MRFHPVTTDGTSGVQRAPAGPGIAAAIEAPENLEYRFEYLRLVEGQVLFFPIAGNMPYGQFLGYGKSLIDDITMDPPPGIPIDGPTPLPRSTNEGTASCTPGRLASAVRPLQAWCWRGPGGNASVGIGARNGRSDEPHARLVCSCPSVMGGRDHVGWRVSLCWDPSEEDSMNHGGIFAFIWKSTFRGPHMIRTIAIAMLLLPVLGAVEESAPKIFTIHDGLEKASQPLPTVPAETILRDVGGDRFESASDGTGQAWLRMPRDIHPVVRAAHLAFADHRPLALSPDIVWLLMTQMVAREVVADPERFRGILVSHQAGQEVLKVRRDDFVLGAATNDWPGVFAEFEEQIVARAHDGVASIFSHAFASSQAAEVATRRVTLMKTVSPFYRYEVYTMCGIPEIHLYGSPQDWTWIRTHMGQFGKLGLAKRMQALEPVIDQFVLAVEGQGNPYFWRNFYKYEAMSGNETTSGWINLFFLKHEDDVVPFDWGQKRPESRSELGIPTEDGLPYDLHEVPPAWVAQEFLWFYHGQRLPMMLRAGFLGIEQDLQTLALRPRLGWQVMGVQDTPDQRSLRSFLADKRSLWEVLRGITYDAGSKSLRCTASGETPYLPREAWLLMLPMMTGLEIADVSFLHNHYAGKNFDPWSDQAFCRALVALPSVRRVVATPNLCTPECWAILRQRKDWKLAAPGEP